MTSDDDNSRTALLLAQARKGDREALATLLNDHAQRLLASVRAELGERARQRLESQDVMQEVYLDVLRNIDSFVDRGADSFLAWLRRIAVNRICDVDRRHFRTQKRAGEARMGDLGGDESMLGLLDVVSASMTAPSQAVDRTDRVRRLRDALNALEEDHRDVIRYRYLQQLSVTETAARMDRSDRAIRSLCVRALIRLREQLTDVL
ncbi:MAG TPA: sigma-70 family RNA polymerase sigma factor [Phycisphaerae bacterium]|nr:sigma-70 family RNA polymerase sigma factor [Phycisphaerae bacterium]